MSLSKIKIDELSLVERNKLLSDAWLNIRVDEHKLPNPLLSFPSECSDNPHLYITWLLMQPEYFSFLCSEILNIEIWPMQGVVLKELWNHKFPMLIATRGWSKSFTLALYAILRMILLPGRKLVITGASFRQSKIIFEYMENIWYEAPLLRDMCRSMNKPGPERGSDMWNFRIGSSITRAVPLGSGDKIRGLRANDTLADEFSSIVREIFETVILGFSAVRANPVEGLKLEAMRALAKRLNIELPFESVDDYNKDNQTIISGTAYYDFNHFSEYWKMWRNIICSAGNENDMARSFAGGKVPSALNWKDFSVIRFPIELVPDGFLDKSQIARSEATMNSSTYRMEYGCIFEKDSNGFFKRTLIEQCVASDTNNIRINDKLIKFSPTIFGHKNKKYVMAVDPASEVDNFAIIIIELHNEHRRIVYCWTTDKKDYKERKESGLCQDGDFYAFCTRKIRELLSKFNCEAIAIDSQGGGHQITGLLSNPDLMKPGEQPLWPVIDYDEPKDSDAKFGLHIIHLIQFADAEWTHAANHGLRQDFESKMCLFPHKDALDLALAMSDSEIRGSIYDTLEDCIWEIEELKNELSTIVPTKTPTGKDKWDTPEIKLPGSKKGRMRKDRYSALLMANATARLIMSELPKLEYDIQLGWAEKVLPNQLAGKMYNGPAAVAEALNSIYD